MKKQLSTYQVMMGEKIEIINPFNKGIILNICDFWAPLLNFAHKGQVNIQGGLDPLEIREHKS
jgi:hypothetical protein